MTDQNGHRLRLLRERFARFLGESNGRPTHRRSNRGNVPLWEYDADDRHSVTSGQGPRASRDYSRRAIQVAAYDVFERLNHQNWQAYVVGGTLRDLMSDLSRGGSSSIIPRDMDIIVPRASIHELENCFSDLIRRHTRFGGLHLVKKIAQVCEVHFDVWPLAETWAFKEYHINPEISRFPFTPFLNLDAVAIELFPQRRRARRVYENGFFQGISSGLIDINFESNPFPDVCVIRALIMAGKLQFSLSPRLATFICSRSKQPGVAEALRKAQLSHYGKVRCSERELSSWLGSIEEQMSAGADRIEVRIPRARQLALWADHPPLEAGAFAAACSVEDTQPASPAKPGYAIQHLLR